MATHIFSRTFSGLCVAAAFSWTTAAGAAVLVYAANLNGATESPPRVTPGTGTATVTIDTTLNTMAISMTFAGLTAGTTASHIHARTAAPLTGNAGVATQLPYFVGFPIGVTSGSYSSTFDLLAPTTYNPAFVTANGGTAAGAEAALLSAIASGEAYLNIHTTEFPAGEIRGFLVAVPEPASWTMMLVGFMATGFALRARKRPHFATSV